MGLFANASPAHIMLGANDKGSVPLPMSQDPLPQHIPLVYLFAQKGTDKKVYFNGVNAVANYGSDTFNADGAYHTHTTQMITELFGAANSCCIKRIIPADANPPSSVVLYVDIVAAQVPNYLRDSLGHKVPNAGGTGFLTDVVTPTIAGYEIKFISETGVGGNIGTAVSKAGTMTIGGVTSTMYPIMEYRAAFQGEYYNNIGFTIESPINADVDTKTLEANKAMPYKLGLVKRLKAGAQAQVFNSLYGEPSVMCTLKPGSKNPTTTLKADLKTVFDTNWFNETDPLLPVKYNDYEGVHVYTAELETLLSLIMVEEKKYISSVPATWNDALDAATISWFDFTTADSVAIDAEIYLINLFTGKSTTGIEYFSLKINSTTPTLTGTQTEVFINKTTPVYLGGGSDGTMNNTNFEIGVNIELAKYLDPDSQVIDNATNVETHLYDSGYTQATKSNLLNFIGVRKDTIVALGTHEYAVGTKVVPLSDTRAIAVLLKTQAMLFPESDFFGTPVARAVIMGGGYKLYSSLSGEYYPLTFELAIKSARMMGAGNYRWKAGQIFDHGPAAVLTKGRGYEPSFIPDGVKPILWNVGLVWAQPKDRSTYFIPAVQTVYDNDTSPMNTWLTICGLVTLNRIASDAWREFTGTSTMDDAQFKEVVLNYLISRLDGIFDGLLIVHPEVIIDAKDAARGYSWQVLFKLYSGNMKTKMVSYTEVYRLNALAV